MSRYASIDSPYAREFLFEGGRRGALLIHGFTGSPGHMLRLGEAFRDEGYTALGILLPGHGTTVEDMERTGWRHWFYAAREGYRRLADRCDDIFVVGLSMGGTLALLLAGELPLRGAAPIAAPMRIYDTKAIYTPFFKYFIRYLDNRPSPSVAESHPYSVGYKTTPLRKVPDLLRLMRMAEERLPRITCPLLIVQPLLDGTVMPESALIIRDGAVRAARREIVWLPRSSHVCTLEPEFDFLKDNLLHFFKSC